MLKHCLSVLLPMVLLTTLVHSEPSRPTFIIAPGDASKVVVQKPDPQSQYQLTVYFTAAKQTEFSNFSKSNVGKKINLSINGKIVATPLIIRPLDVPSIYFDCPSQDVAQADDEYLMRKP